MAGAGLLLGAAAVELQRGVSGQPLVAVEGNAYNRYGSDTLKQAYIYGGLDRGTTVADYDRSGTHVGPFSFTGGLRDVTVDLDDDQDVDHDAAGEAELGRE